MIFFTISVLAFAAHLIELLSLRDLLPIVLDRALPDYSRMVHLWMLLVLLLVNPNFRLILMAHPRSRYLPRCVSWKNLGPERGLVALLVYWLTLFVRFDTFFRMRVLVGKSLCLHFCPFNFHNSCIRLDCNSLLLLVKDWQVLGNLKFRGCVDPKIFDLNGLVLELLFA